MTNQLYALIKYPGEDVSVTYINNELGALQEKLGGRIEAVTLNDDLVIIRNAESLTNQAKYNCSINGIQFFGPILILGYKSEEFIDCPLSRLKARQEFPELFVDGGCC